MHKNIIELLSGIEKAMTLVNEQMTEEVLSKMTPEQLELLAEARKASSKEELKTMTDKLVKINEQMKN